MRRSLLTLAGLAVVLALVWVVGRHLRHWLAQRPATGLTPHRRPVPPPQDRPLRVYLLLGQSNMVGQGPVTPADTVPDPRVLRLSPAGTWELAQDPLHTAAGPAGVGPGFTFGRVLAAADPSVAIGLVPAAINGTSLAAWQPGASFGPRQPYAEALALARRARQRGGTLAGILWHQGESDNTPAQAATYGRRLQAFIARLRADLHAPTLPFVAGEIPFRLRETDAAGRPHPSAEAALNDTLAALAHRVPHYALVSAAGATDLGDQRHLDAASARLLGRRYAAAMLRLQAAIGAVATPPPPAPAAAARR